MWYYIVQSKNQNRNYFNTYCILLYCNSRNNDKGKGLEVSNLQKKISELEQERNTHKKEVKCLFG